MDKLINPEEYAFLTESDFLNIQLFLQERIRLKFPISIDAVCQIAGVDLAYWMENGTEMAVCCIVVLDFQTKKVLEKVHLVRPVRVPYIAGFLAFRELPLIVEAAKLLKSRPDLYMFDGNGYLHPRHVGIAAQASFYLDKPTVGVAKSYYKIEGTEYDMPENEAGAYADIFIRGTLSGRALRTHRNVKPIFVSPGNDMDMDSAVEIAIKMTERESHIPLPTRLADLETHKMREYCKSLYTQKKNS